MKGLRWNSIALLSLIYIVALAARLLKLILDPMLQRDSAVYLMLAERWQETNSYSQAIVDGTIVPPLPLFTIVKMMDFGVNAEIAGRCLALFFGAMVPVLGYIISHLLFRKLLLSIISVSLFIFHPTLVSYAIQPLRENYYLFFEGLIGISLINCIIYKRTINWITSGVLVAFCIFCRYEALEMLIICPIILLFIYLRSKIKIKKTIWHLSAFFFGSLLAISVLLAIIDYNAAFVFKISKYKDKTILYNDIRNYTEYDPQISE